MSNGLNRETRCFIRVRSNRYFLHVTSFLLRLALFEHRDGQDMRWQGLTLLFILAASVLLVFKLGPELFQKLI